MEESDPDLYQIVLEKIPYDKQAETSLYLSGCFNLPPATTRGIVASGPIALISDLSRDQAEAIVLELEESLPEGVTLRIARAGETSRISRLQWPRAPRVYGRDVREFTKQRESHTLACPLCGGAIRVSRDADGGFTASVPSGSERVRVPGASRRAPAAEDSDPLFSGIKPLATDTANFASVRSLEAGDSGFWSLPGQNVFEPAGKPSAIGKGAHRAAREHAKAPNGLAAFMKPGAFAVVVGRTKDPQVVKMIADILGDDEETARTKCLNLGLCVVRGVALDEAQNLIARFRNLGARARIVKPM